MKSVLVTGGAGFIGSDFVRMLVSERPDLKVVNFDALTYAGNLANVRECEQSGSYHFVRGDIRDANTITRALADHSVDTIVNFAAESHVDRSIQGPQAFAETNVVGTVVLLQAAREHGIERFLQVSTDEVYGSLGPQGAFSETSPIQPNSPYSASKAAADHFVRSFGETFGMNVVTTRCSNNYGPYQFPEKLIPLMIHRAQRDETLPVYGDGLQVRDWIYVRDHSRAILAVLEGGRSGDVYNIGAENDCENLRVVRAILSALGKPESLIRHVEDRPGHDRRYAMDAAKIRGELGWTPTIEFEEGIAQTIAWYQDNVEWLEAVTSGEYKKFYDSWYAGR